MGTVIDELIVELKLDPKQFDQAQKDQISKLRVFEREHERHSKKMAKDTDALTQAFSLLQGRLLAIAGLFMGGMGISQFTEHITRLTAQTGYLAQSLGMSTAEITKWQNVGATVGASPGEMAQAIASIRQGQADINLGRQSGLSAFAYMTAQSGQGPAVNLFDKNGQQRSSDDVMTDISRWYQAQIARGPDATNNATRTLQSMLGFSQGTINTLALGPEEIAKRNKELQQYGPTESQVKKFKELQETFARMEISATALGRAIVEKLEPTIKYIIDLLDKLFKYLTPATDEKVKEFTDKHLPEMGSDRSIVGRIKRWWNGDKGTPSEPGAVGGGTSTAPGGANDNVGAGLGGSEFLKARRKRFADEINANPDLKKRLAAIIDLENPKAGTAVAESLFNRMDYTGGTVASGTGGGSRSFYGPVRSGLVGPRLAELERDPARMRARMRQIDEALNGSNLIQGYTDQGSAGDPNYLTGGVGVNINRERFNYFGGGPGGHAGAMRYRQMIIDGVNRESTKPRLPDANAGTFDSLWNSRIGNLGGAGAALRSGGGIVNNSSRSSQTHIDNMHVTVPPGADPAGYARGISQELQRYDNVMNANEGLL